MYNQLMAAGGGDDDKKPRRLTPQEMQQFNSFLDFVKSKGLQGSPTLDHDPNLRQSLFDEYNKGNNTSITPDFIRSVQNEHQQFANQSKDFLKRKGDPNSDKLYPNESPLDGIFGQQTSQQYFVPAVLKQYQDNQLMSAKNLGLVNSDLKAAQPRPIPAGVKTFITKEGKTMYENSDGDLIPVNQ
jgi:hypothetical protein